MRQELITYDLFCQATQKMQEQGEKISVRTIHSHIGGSFAKLAGFLKRWRAEQAHAQSLIDHELSTNLKQAILAEIGKAVAETKSKLEAQIAQDGEQLDEAHEALARQEKTLEEYEQQINALQQQVGVMQQIQSQHVARIALLERKLEESIQQHHEIDKKAVIAETRCLELEKQLFRQEKDTAQKNKSKDKKSAISSAASI